MTLNNILMVAPKTETAKYDLSFSLNEKDLSLVEAEDKPFTFEDFQQTLKQKTAKKT